MRKKVTLVFALTGAMLVSATAASAASADMLAPAPRAPASAKLALAPAPHAPAAGKLALAGVSAAAQSDQGGSAQPRTKPRNRFFGLPLLSLLFAGGTGIAIASSGDDDSNPTSP